MAGHRDRVIGDIPGVLSHMGIFAGGTPLCYAQYAGNCPDWGYRLAEDQRYRVNVQRWYLVPNSSGVKHSWVPVLFLIVSKKVVVQSYTPFTKFVGVFPS